MRPTTALFILPIMLLTIVLSAQLTAAENKKDIVSLSINAELRCVLSNNTANAITINTFTQKEGIKGIGAPLHNYRYFNGNGETPILSLRPSACYAPGSLSPVSIQAGKALTFSIAAPRGKGTHAQLVINYIATGSQQGQDVVSNKIVLAHISVAKNQLIKCRVGENTHSTKDTRKAQIQPVPLNPLDPQTTATK